MIMYELYIMTIKIRNGSDIALNKTKYVRLCIIVDVFPFKRKTKFKKTNNSNER